MSAEGEFGTYPIFSGLSRQFGTVGNYAQTASGASCQEDLATAGAIHNWHGHLDKGADVQAIFFDLQKALDSVPHGRLLDILISLNIPTLLISWIANYLYNRKQQDLVGVSGVNSDSDFWSATRLSSLTFAFSYVDGLTSIPLALSCLLMIYFYTRLSVTLRTLWLFKKDVDLLTSWINEHNLTLNVRNCKCKSL